MAAMLVTMAAAVPGFVLVSATPAHALTCNWREVSLNDGSAAASFSFGTRLLGWAVARLGLRLRHPVRRTESRAASPVLQRLQPVALPARVSGGHGGMQHPFQLRLWQFQQQSRPLRLRVRLQQRTFTKRGSLRLGLTANVGSVDPRAQRGLSAGAQRVVGGRVRRRGEVVVGRLPRVTSMTCSLPPRFTLGAGPDGPGPNPATWTGQLTTTRTRATLSARPSG